jgi:hypothetical protein
MRNKSYNLKKLNENEIEKKNLISQIISNKKNDNQNNGN